MNAEKPKREPMVGRSVQSLAVSRFVPYECSHVASTDAMAKKVTALIMDRQKLAGENAQLHADRKDMLALVKALRTATDPEAVEELIDGLEAILEQRHGSPDMA